MGILKSVKQEEFCKQRVFEKKNQKESYRASYNTQNMTEKQIDEESSKLSKNPKISQRINELNEGLVRKAEEKALYTVEESFKELERLKELAIANTGNTGKADMSAAIKAEELRGKLARLYEETVNIKKLYSDEIEYL